MSPEQLPYLIGARTGAHAIATFAPQRLDQRTNFFLHVRLSFYEKPFNYRERWHEILGLRATKHPRDVAT